MKYNRVVLNMKESMSMKKGLGKNKDLINLAIGTPDLAPPDFILETIYNFADKPVYGYIPTKGTLHALERFHDVVLDGTKEINPYHNLSFVAGAKLGIYLSLKTILNQGDNVVIMEPYWVSYPEIIKSLNANKIIWKPQIVGRKIKFSLDTLKEIFSSNIAKVIIINQPNNPSGTVFSKSFLKQISNLARQYNCWVLIDEVYKDLCFDQQHRNNTNWMKENIIRVGSLSKNLCIPGLRIGYVVGSEKFITNFNLLNQHISTCLNTLSISILESLHKEKYFEYLQKNNTIYKRRYNFSKEYLQKKGIDVLESEGTFYLLADLKNKYSSGDQASNWLEQNKNILVTSGRAYGECFKHYLRICLTHDLPILENAYRQL